MKSWRSPVWIRRPFGFRIGLSGDGKWEIKGKPLPWAGWTIQRGEPGETCFTIWCGPFAAWLARSAR